MGATSKRKGVWNLALFAGIHTPQKKVSVVAVICRKTLLRGKFKKKGNKQKGGGLHEVTTAFLTGSNL